MSEYTKETIVTNKRSGLRGQGESASYRTLNYIVYFVFAVIDILLAFRFAFKLLGANPSTGFVEFIYNLSGVFVAPFAGIFNTSVTTGNVVASMFEPATLVAFVVYAVIAWVIAALIRVAADKQQY